MNSKLLVRISLLLLLLAGVAVTFSWRDSFDQQQISAWLDSAGLWAPLLFMLIYALATVVFLPGSVITLLGGAVFGPVYGTLYNLSGATVGAAASFIIARYLASNWVQQRAEGRFKQLLQGVEAEGWRFVAFVRLVPLFPFNLLNYVLGLTRIAFIPYVVTSFICMLPGAIAYTYLGYVGRELMAGDEAVIKKVLLALALLTALAFLPRFIARLRQKALLSVEELKARLEENTGLLLLDVREAKEFYGELGHVAAARNIPLSEFRQQISTLDEHLEKPVALICHTDRRSAKAAQWLASRGFSDVHVVQGGMVAWHDRGYEVECGKRET